MPNFLSIECKLYEMIDSSKKKTLVLFSYGYDGTKEQTKTVYPLSDNEILYVIGTVCILYEINSKEQRFYMKHNNPITW